MEFKRHILIGLIASYALVYLFNLSPLAGLIIFLSSWMIDGDHYLWYAFEMKDWNPFHAIKWYTKSIPKWFSMRLKKREKFKRGVFIFYSLIFWIILAALSFLHPFFLWVLMGIAIHMTADILDLHFRNEPIYNKIFPYLIIRRNKNKKKLKEL